MHFLSVLANNKSILYFSLQTYTSSRDDIRQCMLWNSAFFSLYEKLDFHTKGIQVLKGLLWYKRVRLCSGVFALRYTLVNNYEQSFCVLEYTDGDLCWHIVCVWVGAEGDISWHQYVPIQSFVFLFWSIKISPILRNIQPVQD